MASRFNEVVRPESRPVALVTGATGAIGYAIAEQIAARHEYDVVLVCRDAEKAATMTEAVRRRTGNSAVRSELVDLSRRASITALTSARYPALSARIATPWTHCSGSVKAMVDRAIAEP